MASPAHQPTTDSQPADPTGNPTQVGRQHRVEQQAEGGVRGITRGIGVQQNPTAPGAVVVQVGTGRYRASTGRALTSTRC